MKSLIITILAIAALATSCGNAEKKAKETINKSGEVVGEIATEFTEGITEGVDRTLDSKIVLSDALKAKGLSTGKFFIENDSVGKDNKLVIYLIAEKDFNSTLVFRVADKKDVEFGRQQLPVNMKAGTGEYHDVVFDNRTNIEVKSTIHID